MRNKNLKKCLAGTLVLTMALSFSACGEQVLEKKAEDVSAGEVAVEDVSDGIYVLTKEGKYYKPDNKGESYTGLPSGADASRYIYNTPEKVMPTLGKGDQLVIVSSNPITEGITSEKFKYRGWTIGIAGMSKGTDGNYTFTSSNLLANMDAANVFGESISNTAMVYKVDGKSDFAVSKSGFISGLQKNKIYDLEVFQGTIYTKAQIKADTKMWVSQDVLVLDQLTYTKKGYAVINIDELSNGYYSFNGTGLIRVKR